MSMILAICGSLSASSSNALLIETARVAAGDDLLSIFSDLAALPPFNPDLDTDQHLPTEVAAFRQHIADAKVILVSVPEYAHGLPGTFKNALDWLVGSTVLVGKPVAIWTASTRTTHVPAQLRETLATMSANVDESASAAVELPRATRSEDSTAAWPLINAYSRSILLTAIERLKHLART